MKNKSMNEQGVSSENRLRKAAEPLLPYAETLYAMAYRLYRRGIYADAHQLLATLLLIVPDNPRYLVAAGMVLHSLQDDHNALRHYRSALAIAPQHVPALVAMGETYLALGMGALAQAAFMEVGNLTVKPAWQVYQERAQAWLASMELSSGKQQEMTELAPRRTTEAAA